MNELIRFENGEVKMDSRMIAEHFGKDHKNVLADVRDELESLEIAGLSDQLIFQPIEYLDGRNRKQKAFEMGEEGAMQLAARYDAVSRRKLILKIKELKTKPQEQQIPKSPMEFIVMMAQENMKIEKQVNQLTVDVQTIKAASVVETDDWRSEITAKMNAVVMARGGGKDTHLDVRSESYQALELKARCNLALRQENKKDRMRRIGASMTAIKKISKIDVIEEDAHLKSIYTGIVRDMVIKYC